MKDFNGLIEFLKMHQMIDDEEAQKCLQLKEKDAAKALAQLNEYLFQNLNYTIPRLDEEKQNLDLSFNIIKLFASSTKNLSKVQHIVGELQALDQKLSDPTLTGRMASRTPLAAADFLESNTGKKLMEYNAAKKSFEKSVADQLLGSEEQEKQKLLDASQTLESLKERNIVTEEQYKKLQAEIKYATEKLDDSTVVTLLNNKKELGDALGKYGYVYETAKYHIKEYLSVREQISGSLVQALSVHVKERQEVIDAKVSECNRELLELDQRVEVAAPAIISSSGKGYDGSSPVRSMDSLFSVTNDLRGRLDRVSLQASEVKREAQKSGIAVAQLATHLQVSTVRDTLQNLDRSADKLVHIKRDLDGPAGLKAQVKGLEEMSKAQSRESKPTGPVLNKTILAALDQHIAGYQKALSNISTPDQINPLAANVKMRCFELLSNSIKINNRPLKPGQINDYMEYVKGKVNNLAGVALSRMKDKVAEPSGPSIKLSQSTQRFIGGERLPSPSNTVVPAPIVTMKG